MPSCSMVSSPSLLLSPLWPPSIFQKIAIERQRVFQMACILEPLYGILKIHCHPAASGHYPAGNQPQPMPTLSIKKVKPWSPVPSSPIPSPWWFSALVWEPTTATRIGKSTIWVPCWLLKAAGNYIDGLISAGVGVAIIALSLVDIQGPLGFLHYTGDFFITLILVMISLKEPISVLANSFKEFARSTIQGNHIHDKVLEIFHQVLNSQADKLDILVFKQGMYIKVKIYILTPEDAQLIENLATKKASLSTCWSRNLTTAASNFHFKQTKYTGLIISLYFLYSYKPKSA